MHMKLPGFTAQESLHIHKAKEHKTYQINQYHQENTEFIRPAWNFRCLICLIRCNITCSPPNMCLVSCPQACSGECNGTSWL
jgi:hypothetical protein